MGGIVVWSGGRLRDPDEPLLSALDHGVTVGDGVFETCGVVRGDVFALTRHLARLTRSAVGIGLVAPDLEAVRQGIAAVLAADDGIGRLRVTVTAGVGPLGTAPRPADGPRDGWSRGTPGAGAGRAGALGAQRTVGGRRLEDHLLRRERRAPGLGQGPRR